MDNSDKGAFAAANMDGMQIGLTKREYFAGLAMQGLAASSSFDPEFSPHHIAVTSVRVADALLEALQQEVGDNE